MKETSLERKKRLKKEGRCRDCAKPLEQIRVNNCYCVDCLIKYRTYAKERTLKLKQTKQCLDCAKPLEENNDNNLCFICLKLHNISCFNYSNNLEKNNLCKSCGKQKEENNRKFCLNCANKNKERCKKWKEYCATNGLCNSCGEIVIEHRTKCKDCMTKDVVRAKKRLNNNPAYKLMNIISSSINQSLKKINKNKNGKTRIQYLPYTIVELKEHIEKQFEPWMNWNNRGYYLISEWDDNDISTWKWQLDHIIPQADLIYYSVEDENFKKCWALENLRPLNAKQNIMEGILRTRHTNKSYLKSK